MNLRESFAATHHASLEWSPISERAIDKVAASGLCDPLGVLLWKARYMLEEKAMRRAEEEIYRRLANAFKRCEDLNFSTPTNLRKVAAQSLREFLSDKCLSCSGRASVTINDLKITCQACSGSGIRRYTDFERGGGMGLTPRQASKLERHFRWCAELMGSLDTEVNRTMAEQLER